jgi:hypothetical protein
MCAGELFVVFELWLVVCALCLSIVLSQMCRVVAPKGCETCLLQVIFLSAFPWLSIACWSFFLFVSFSFCFLSGYYMWVLSMYSSRGRLRTMSSSRIGGRSLTGVMSD